MNHLMTKLFFVASICLSVICGHKIDQDCFKVLSIKESSRGIELPYVKVKIIRVNRPFPLKDIFIEEEEIVTLIPGVLFNATFDGDEFHSQAYNPRELFLYTYFDDGFYVFAAMGTYSYYNYNGTTKEEFGCISWNLELADFINKTDSQVYGEELKEIMILNASIPVLTRDLIRLEILDPGNPNGPSYDNECAFLGQFARSTNDVMATYDVTDDVKDKQENFHSVNNALYTSMRHVQVRYDLSGKEEMNIVKTSQISNLTEGSTQVFQFEIPPMSQMPDSIKVTRNLSVTYNVDETVTVSIAFLEYLTKPLWFCNIEKNLTEIIFSKKWYFSHYQGINSEGEYQNIADYIEFFDEYSSGQTISELKLLSIVMSFLTVTVFKQSYFW